MVGESFVEWSPDPRPVEPASLDDIARRLDETNALLKAIVENTTRIADAFERSSRDAPSRAKF